MLEQLLEELRELEALIAVTPDDDLPHQDWDLSPLVTLRQTHADLLRDIIRLQDRAVMH